MLEIDEIGLKFFRPKILEILIENSKATGRTQTIGAVCPKKKPRWKSD